MEVKIPYTPRPLWAKEIHRGLETHRFSVLVCHRRFGKTVGVINHLIKMAVLNKRRAPQYAYLAPFFRQAKRIAWKYLKYYTSVIPGIKVNNVDCSVELPSRYPGTAGATITILGADNPDALRGIYLDGAVMDEYGQMKEELWTEIVRPALADRKGWAVFLGTPKGQNAFFTKYQEARAKPDWFCCVYKASETGVLSEAELAAMRADMPPEAYAQEMECDFSVAAFNTLLGGADIEAAKKCHYDELQLRGQPKIMGVDVARFGGDRSCICCRWGLAVMKPYYYSGLDTMTLAGTIVEIKNRFKPDAIFIDSGAMGAGVIDRLRQLGHPVIDVAFGGKAINADLYINKRTEMYFNLARYIKQDGGSLPEDASLSEELASCYYGYDRAGRLKLMDKDEIREMLGRSPDGSDALALTFAAPVVPVRDFHSPYRNKNFLRANTSYDFGLEG